MKSKKYLALLTALIMFLLALMPVSAAPSANLMHNGGFNAADLSHWWPRGDWGGGNFNYTPSHGIDGTGGLVAVGRNGASDQNAGIYYSSTPLPASGWSLVPGERYTFSCDIFRPEGTTGKGYIKIVYNDGRDTELTSSARTTKIGEWETVSLSFSAPSSQIWPVLIANALPPGQKIYYDNATLISENGAQQPDFTLIEPDQSKVLGDNLFKNGSFNRLNVANWWCREDWVGLNGADKTLGLLFRYSATGGVDDSGCYIVDGHGEGSSQFAAGLQYHDHVTTKGTELTPGVTYYFSADVWRSEGCDCEVWIDADAESTSKGSSDFAEKNGEWEHLYFRFVPTEDDPFVWMRLVARGLAEGETVKVDNLSLRVVGEEPTYDEYASSSMSSGSAISVVQRSEAAEEPEATPGLSPLWIALIAAGAAIVVAVIVILVIRAGKRGKGEKNEK